MLVASQPSDNQNLSEFVTSSYRFKVAHKKILINQQISEGNYIDLVDSGQWTKLVDSGQWTGNVGSFASF